MEIYGILLFLHLIGATIWTGGHIVMTTAILPTVLRERSPEKLLAFESRFERIGMPALIVQIITGLLLAGHMLPPSEWFNLANPISHPILVKLTLLTLTAALALDARFRVLPKLDAHKLTDMAWHIVPVTVLGILFVATGASFRTGWLY